VTLHCSMEQDLLDAAASGRWPDRADAALRTHVASCPACADLASFAVALLEDRDAALAGAAVPSASAVWWRSQLRAREEAARLAARPLVIVQAVATGSVFAVCAALAPAASEWLRGLMTPFGAREWWTLPHELSAAWVAGTAAYTALPMLAVALWLVLAPVVVYLALDD